MKSSEISLFSTFKIALYTGDSLLISQTFYIPSFEAEEEILKSIDIEKMKKKQWSNIFVTDAKRSNCVDKMFFEKKL